MSCAPGELNQIWFVFTSFDIFGVVPRRKQTSTTPKCRACKYRLTRIGGVWKANLSRVQIENAISGKLARCNFRGDLVNSYFFNLRASYSVTSQTVGEHDYLLTYLLDKN